MLNIIYNAKPKYYACFYVFLIPVYACVFYSDSEALLGEKYSLLECLYFSVVTITTLGYGEITPVSDLGMIVTLTEPLLGVLLIGLFLNSLSRVRSETTREEDEQKEQDRYDAAQMAKLNGHFNLINPLIKTYQRSVGRITSPFMSGDSWEYKSDFKFSDMKDLFVITGYVDRNHTESAAQFYFKSLSPLQSELSDLIKLVDLRLFPKLERSCLFFVEEGSSSDVSEVILGAEKTDLAAIVKKSLEEHEGEPIYLDSNLMNSYVTLYRQIKSQMELIEIIKAEVELIMSEG